MIKQKEKKNVFKKLQVPSFELRDRGFSLIEMMVSLSIFTVVMTVALGSLLAVIDSNKKSQVIQSLMTNLNFVIDDISRNARLGDTYRCSNNLQSIGVPKDCSSGKTIFAFEGARGSGSITGDQVVYRLNNSAIEKSVNGGSTFSILTDPLITIDNLKFYVAGSLSSDSKQPRVLMVISGTAGVKEKIKTSFNIQTTITQRTLDI